MPHPSHHVLLESGWFSWSRGLWIVREIVGFFSPSPTLPRPTSGARGPARLPSFAGVRAPTETVLPTWTVTFSSWSRLASPLSTLGRAPGAPSSFPAEMVAVSSSLSALCTGKPCVVPGKGCIGGICCWHISIVPFRSHKPAC